MRILVSGSHGSIGSALVGALWRQGHNVLSLVRRASRAGRADEQVIRWEPSTGQVDIPSLEGFDAVVHLSGESVMGRWSEDKMAAIRSSRVQSTTLLCESLARVKRRPAVLVCASAVGYYGDQGDQLLDEQSHAGANFLADVCRAWEDATNIAAKAGIRVVNTRFGIALHADGGALAQMLGAFGKGLGGKLGTGRQWWSWAAREDIVEAIHFAILNDSLRGPVNVCSPNPVTNEQFTRTLADVLGRRAIFRVPAAALRLVFGPMADQVLLASARVMPRKLLVAGFVFQYPELRRALESMLNQEGGHAKAG